MPPQPPLAVISAVMRVRDALSRAGDAVMPALSDVQMLTQCDGGRQRSEAELHRLLRETGFHPGPTRRTAGPALLEATAG